MPEGKEHDGGQIENARKIRKLGKKIESIARPITEVLRESDGNAVFGPTVPPDIVLRRVIAAGRYNESRKNKSQIINTPASFPDSASEKCLHCNKDLPTQNFHLQRTGDPNGYTVQIDRQDGHPSVKTKGPEFAMALPYLAVHLLAEHGMTEGDGNATRHIAIDMQAVDRFFKEPVVRSERFEPLKKRSSVP